MARILGVSCYFHDAAATLVEDGVLVAAAEEERFSRRKHDASFPYLAVQFCLDQAGVTGRDVDYAAFYERPRRKLNRTLVTSAAMGAPARDAFVGSMKAWLTERRGIQGRIAGLLGIPRDRVLFVDHHVSHAASAYLPSGFDSAALMTIDGVGEWATATLGAGASTGSHTLDIAREIDFPHSLGLFYSACTALLGFEVNEGEYKVMGMAPYGEPKYVDELERVLQIYDDGSFWLDMSYFSFHHSSRRAYTEKLPELLGIEPRRRDEPFSTEESAGASLEERARSRRYADVAASVQEITERAIVNMARAARRESGSRNLCFAGGVALNGLANRRILAESGFDRLFIPPAPGDSGGAYGAALYVEHVVLGRPERTPLEHAYWGSEYAEGAVAAALRNVSGLRHRRLDDEGALLDTTVEALAQGSVVGWFQGRFELGPRALGNRSILADPRREDMKERINEKVKFREPFRPFAPAALEDFAATLVPAHEALQHPARFMLLISRLDPEHAEELPAVNHFGTARIQTVRPEWNTRFAALLGRWGEAAGLPVLLNTSFNLRGEPIVSSPEDALSTFQRSGLDLLVLGDTVVEKVA